MREIKGTPQVILLTSSRGLNSAFLSKPSYSTSSTEKGGGREGGDRGGGVRERGRPRPGKKERDLKKGPGVSKNPCKARDYNHEGSTNVFSKGTRSKFFIFSFLTLFYTYSHPSPSGFVDETAREWSRHP